MFDEFYLALMQFFHVHLLTSLMLAMDFGCCLMQVVAKYRQMHQLDDAMEYQHVADGARDEQ